MTNPKNSAVIASKEYRLFIEDLTDRINRARISTARTINHGIIILYWDIGHAIVGKQQTLGWGDSVVEIVAADLRRSFPESNSYSADNVWRMRQFYVAYSNAQILGQAVPEMESVSVPSRKPAILGQGVPETRQVALMTGHRKAIAISLDLLASVPWGQNLLILKRIDDPRTRLYYLQATARFGWSRNVLLNQIKAGAYERAMTQKKSHNFGLALPEHQAEQADEMLKSSYNLEFLGVRRVIKERKLEDLLVSRLQQFLLELGYGFCFIGRQYRISLGQKEYFIDLLFYHRHLKALVAFDLKVGSFEPEFAGKMDFYLNLLNDKERAPGDQPSIGIILCAEKDDVEVEYSLRTKTNPIGVAAYELQSKLPSKFKGKLPTAEELSAVVRTVLPQ